MSEHIENNETTCDISDSKPRITAYYNEEDETATCSIIGKPVDVASMLTCIFEAMFKKAPMQALFIIEHALVSVLPENKEAQETDGN